MAVVVKSVFTSPVTLSGYGQATDGQAVLGAGVKLQEAARRRENHAGWYGWNMHREELYGRLSREHAATAEGLMEENRRKDERMTESYEELRDQAPGEGGEAWRRADRRPRRTSSRAGAWGRMTTSC